MPIFQQGQINTTALTVPDLYIQIVPPSIRLLNGVPTNIVGIVGTAAWGRVNSPTPVGDYDEYASIFGPLQARKFDMGTLLACAGLQGNAVEFRCVRATDGTDVAASAVITATDADIAVTVGGTAHVGDTLTLTITPPATSAIPIAYVMLGGDTLQTAAVALAALVNANAALKTLGYVADVPTAGVFHLHYPGTAPTTSAVVTGGGATTTLVAAAPSTLATTQITFAGKYTGSLGNALRVAISAGSAVTTFRAVVSIPGQVPETFDNVSGVGNLFWQALANAINLGNSAIRGPSQLVIASAGAGTSAPVAGTSTLTGGTDGATAIASANLVGVDSYPRTGLYALRGQGVSVAAIADLDDKTTWPNQVAFGLSEGIYMGLVGPAGEFTNITQAATDKTSLGIDSYDAKVLLGDWIYFDDTVTGQVRLVSPQGFMLGILGNQSPQLSSLNKALQGIVGTQKSNSSRVYSAADLAVLAQAQIDVITNPIPRGAVFGFRMGRNSSSNAVIHGDNYTRMTNYLAATLNAGMGQFVGELQSVQPNDETRREAKVTLDAFLQALFDQDMIDDFQVILDLSNNPPDRIALGYMQADVKVRYLAVVEYFIINLEGGQSVSVIHSDVQLATAA
jgi:hypothetical protein